MKRIAHQTLREWRTSSIRKPIILRGARQVGKTHLVRQFGEEFDDFLEINFEQQPEAMQIFKGTLDPDLMLRDLHLLTGHKVTPGKTLLFLDEAQEVPRALIALRYFYEECPELHVIAAGSLLDFAIEKVGVPVGRVSFMYLYPLSFIEFLHALDRQALAVAILGHHFPEAMTTISHQKCLESLAEYMAIGGMPEAVKIWRDSEDIDQCGHIQQAIISSYRQDFEKYCKKYQLQYVASIFDNVPHQLGQRFKYANVPGEFRKRDLAPCLNLLEKALVIRSVRHSDGQGLPLGGQISFDYFKALFIDVALAQTMLGFHPKHWFLESQQTLINKGEMMEVFIGQEILAYTDPTMPAELYYWQRHERGSSAEVDYLTHFGPDVVPIEVKSAGGTALKSMRLFLQTHPKSLIGMRFSTHNYSDFDGIHSYPLYAVANVMLQENKFLGQFLDTSDH